MNQSPPNPPTDPNNNEIYNNQQTPIEPAPESGSYQDAISDAPVDSTPQLTPESYQNPPDQNTPLYENNGQNRQGQAGAIPPPPFEEDNRKKYLFIGIAALIVLIIIFFILKLVLGGKSPNQQSVTLNYWGLWEDEAVMKPLIDEYQKSHPNIKINYSKQNQKEYRERLQAQINQGSGPDIFRFHNTWTIMLQNELAPIPDSIYTKDEFDKTFYPIAQSDLRINSRYYGIPLEIDGLVVLYNEDILKAQNLTVPTEWSQFREVAQKLTTASPNAIANAGVALGTADNTEHFSDILGLMFLQNGVNLDNPLGPCADPSTTTCAPDTLRFYRGFAEQPSPTWDESFDNSINAFAGGKVAMIFAPTWEIPIIKQINPNINLKVAPVPQLEGITINWATYWVEGVSKNSKNQLAAWEFLKFLSSKDAMTKLFTEEAKTRPFGEPYSRVDLADSLKSDPYLGVLMTEAPAMKSFPLASRTYDNGVDDQNIKYLLDGVNSMINGVSADTTMQTIASGWNQVLEKFGYLSTAPVPTTQ